MKKVKKRRGLEEEDSFALEVVNGWMADADVGGFARLREMLSTDAPGNEATLSSCSPRPPAQHHHHRPSPLDDEDCQSSPACDPLRSPDHSDAFGQREELTAVEDSRRTLTTGSRFISPRYDFMGSLPCPPPPDVECQIPTTLSDDSLEYVFDYSTGLTGNLFPFAAPPAIAFSEQTGSPAWAQDRHGPDRWSGRGEASGDDRKFSTLRIIPSSPVQDLFPDDSLFPNDSLFPADSLFPDDSFFPDDILFPYLDGQLVQDLGSDVVEVQRPAAASIQGLAKCNIKNHITIASAGAIKPLVALLRSTDPKTQESAVTALLNLSINDNNKTEIAAAGAIPSLVNVLHVGSAQSMENAAATLVSLSVMIDNKVTIGTSGAIQPLVHLLINGSPRGKKTAATALFSLSKYHQNKYRIVRAGAIKPLVELMADPAAGMVGAFCLYGMVDKAMAVLANLATIPEGRGAIREGGAIPRLVALSQSGTARAREEASQILRWLDVPDVNKVIPATHSKTLLGNEMGNHRKNSEAESTDKNSFVGESRQLRQDVQSLGWRSFEEVFNPYKILCLIADHEFSEQMELVFFHVEGMASLIGIGLPFSKVMIDLKSKNHIVIKGVEYEWENLWMSSFSETVFPVVFERHDNIQHENCASSSLQPSMFLDLSTVEAASKFGLGVEDQNHFVKRSSNEDTGLVREDLEVTWISQLREKVRKHRKKLRIDSVQKILQKILDGGCSGAVHVNPNMSNSDNASQSRSGKSTLVSVERDAREMGTKDGRPNGKSKLLHALQGARTEYEEEELKLNATHKFLVVEVHLSELQCKFYDESGEETICSNDSILQECFIKPTMTVKFFCDEFVNPDEEFVKRINVVLDVDYQLNGNVEEIDRFGWYQNDFLLSFNCEQSQAILLDQNIVSPVINVNTEFTATRGGSSSSSQGSSWDINAKAGMRAFAQAGGGRTTTDGLVQESNGSDRIVETSQQSCLENAPDFTISRKSVGNKMVYKTALRGELRPDFDSEAMWNLPARCKYEATGLFSSVNVRVEGKWELHGKEYRWHEFAAQKELQKYLQIRDELPQVIAGSRRKKQCFNFRLKSESAVESLSPPTVVREILKQKIVKRFLFNHSFSHMELEQRKRPRPYTWVLVDNPCECTRCPVEFLLKDST